MKVYKKIGIIILLIVTLSGCDLFKPREAEPPMQPQKWNEFFTSWELTLDNLEYAYEDKRNKDNYIQILTSDFEFIMDDNDALDLGLQKPYSWNKSAESEMIENMHSNLASTDIYLEINFYEKILVNSSPNEVEVDIAYKIYKSDISDATDMIIGDSTLIFVEDSGFWYLKRWYDNRKENVTNPTWGKLKYEYVQ